MKKKLKTIFINYMVFCALLISLELCLQIVYFAINGRFLFTPPPPTPNEEIFEIHPYLAGRLKKTSGTSLNQIKITTTQKNTRFTGANLEDTSLTRVGVFGGSTTFGTGVTDEDTWPALLQEKLGSKFAVINYGAPGYSTAENIIQMALIAPEDELDIVIFYEGWNDIRNYHNELIGADYYGHGIEQYSNLGLNSYVSTSNRSKPGFNELKNIFVTLRLISKVSKPIIENEIITSFEKADPFVDDLYRRNLRTLKALSHNIEAYPIFIPQVLNYTQFLRNGESTSIWSSRIKNKSMPELLDRFNGFMNDLCPSPVLECTVLNEVLDAQWKDEHFVDDGHFNRAGGLIISEIVAKYILDLEN
ncbi:MAG: SGNH/GDSL hydrolase family protein [Balneolaceae bacterium]